MILSDPGGTRYDVCFSFGGFPVRIHPMFWAIAALLGWRSNDMGYVLTWIACMTVSILVHEYGHAAMGRHYGAKGGQIVLYGLGGLAMSNSRLPPAQHIVVCAAGPGAGMLLGGLVYVVRNILRIDLPGPLDNTAFWMLLYINIGWGLINLIPIFPLDGGQISMSIFRILQGPSGVDNALRLSMFTGVCAALFLLLSWHAVFGAMMVGMLVWENYQMLQARSP